MIQKWSDSENREWTLALDFGALRRIRSVVGVDMLDETKTPALVALQMERVKLGEVLWLVSEVQAIAKGIAQDDFYDGLDGDALDAGFTALASAFCFFCPASTRETVRAAIDAQLRAVAEASTALAKAINGPLVDAAIDEAIKQMQTQMIANLSTLGSLGSSLLPSPA